MDIIIYSFCGISILLLIGKYLRANVKFFQKIFLPSSVIAGLVGLIAVQLLVKYNGGDKLDTVVKTWSTAPGFLINIVFATLFMGKAIPGLGKIWDRAGVQVAYGQIVGWGQYVVGLILVIVLLAPLFNVDPMMAAIIEIGFEGGHGTAAGLVNTFKELGWEEGNALSLGSATFGVFFGVVVGMILVNIASRRGRTEVLQDPKDIPADVLQGIPEISKRESAGTLTTSEDSIEPLAFHLSVVGLAILIGYGILQLLIIFEAAVLTPLGAPKIMTSFPLFPLAMIGGVIIQIFMDKYDKKALLDRKLMMRIHGFALDFLVASALASLSLKAIWVNIIPFMTLMIFGVLWNVFCVMYLAPRMFWEAVFERSIADFGQSMGVTATGLVLLRVVDPKNDTIALEAFGYKQLLHEPILGGGLFTGAAVPLIFNYGPYWILAFTAFMIIFWLFIYRIAFYKKRKRFYEGK